MGRMQSLSRFPRYLCLSSGAELTPASVNPGMPSARTQSHVSHSRTERALQLAPQHVVAGAAVLVLQELSLDPVAQVSIGYP